MYAFFNLQLFVISNLSLTYFYFSISLGTLPSSLSNWLFCKNFYFENNNFFGSIPPEFSQLKNLIDFNADSNNLDGTIPAELESWIYIERFSIYNNMINGNYKIFISLFVINFFSF